MSSQLMLIKAIRNGKLADVKAALDAGEPVELDDGNGEPGLAMGIACFMGHADIVRELAQRGAQVNLADNRLPTSPLSMAIRSKRTEVVRTLLELGATLPEGMECGLTENEVMIACWKAQRAGLTVQEKLEPVALPDIEEIDMTGCAGTDTLVLEADALRMAKDMR
ncbi:MAG: ankyrin repeat domain-containing protein [Dechloromonas sp.]|nr:ankyrin repeat domain-containing protein [Dechloromonas sp.]